jgi:hypothetical protein
MWTLATLATLAFAAEEADLDAYLQSRLDIAHEQVTTVYARDYDGSGSFWFVVDHDGQLIDALDFATRVGDVPVADQLRRQRRRRGWTGGTLTALGFVGASFALPGVVAGEGPVAMVSLAALGTGAVGLVSGPLVLAGRLRLRHPAAAYSEDEATERVQAYNARLREEILGPP